MTKDIIDSPQPEETAHGSEAQQRDPATRQSPAGWFESSFANDVVPTAMVGFDGKCLAANRALAALLGYATGQLISRTLDELAVPQEDPAEPAQRRQLVDGAIDAYQTALNLCHREGYAVPVMLSVSRARDPFEQSHYLLVHAQDMRLPQGQQKGIAPLLRESETLFRDAFDYAAIGMALTTTDGHFVQVNRSFCHIVGHTEDELLRTTVQMIAHPDDLQCDQIVIRRLLAGEIRFYHLEKRFVHKDGHVVFGLESVSMARDAQGRSMYLLRQVQDITARKQAEEAMRRDRDFAESLIETAEAVVLVLDPSERIIRLNPFTEQLTGYQLKDIRGCEWIATLVPAHARELAEQAFEGAVRRTSLRSTVYPIVSKDGTEHEIEWSGRTLTNAQGAITAVLFIGHDITQLKEAQKRLLESERLAAIGQMASGLAHESRNALQQIGACAEMLSMDLQGQPVALDLVAGVQEAGDRLHRLFEDVRAYAVPKRLERVSASVAEVWRSAWLELNELHPQRHMTLRESCDGVDLNAGLSRPALQEAFFNIFENSLEASCGALVLEIHGSDASLNERPALAISIRDNGPGMTEEQQLRILEPFYTTKTQGTGLGMSIAKRIIDAHGGRLEIPPQSQQGATFRILLPREV